MFDSLSQKVYPNIRNMEAKRVLELLSERQIVVKLGISSDWASNIIWLKRNTSFEI